MAQNFYWNPQYKGLTAFYKGTAIKVGEPCEQFILEAFYHDPNRKGLVLAKEDVEVINAPVVVAVGEPESVVAEEQPKKRTRKSKA